MRKNSPKNPLNREKMEETSVRETEEGSLSQDGETEQTNSQYIHITMTTFLIHVDYKTCVKKVDLGGH